MTNKKRKRVVKETKKSGKKTKKAVRRAPKKAAKKTKKKAVRRTARMGKIPAVKKPIGAVTHFYNGIGVAIVRFVKAVPQGTVLEYKGTTTNFTEAAGSMQYDHKAISVAPKGKQVGIKVKKAVREGDRVYLA
jgi:ribosome recycling factor